MSTTFDLPKGPLAPARRSPEGAGRGAVAPDRPRRDGGREKPAPVVRRRAAGRGAAGVARRWGRPALPDLSLLRRWRPRGAGLFGAATLGLSLLGLIYLVQISQVARYGYLLADVQSRQAEVERQNELLVYALSEEQGLTRVSDVAQREYGMRPFDRAAPTESAAAPKRTAGAGAEAAADGPRHRFISVQRPAPAPPAPPPVRPERDGALDRLWNRLVGVGTARSK